MNSTSNFTRPHRFEIRAISVFRVKFDVEFTRQAVNFCIVYTVSNSSLSSQTAFTNKCNNSVQELLIENDSSIAIA